MRIKTVFYTNEKSQLLPEEGIDHSQYPLNEDTRKIHIFLLDTYGAFAILPEEIEIDLELI